MSKRTTIKVTPESHGYAYWAAGIAVCARLNRNLAALRDTDPTVAEFFRKLEALEREAEQEDAREDRR